MDAMSYNERLKGIKLYYMKRRGQSTCIIYDSMVHNITISLVHSLNVDAGNMGSLSILGVMLCIFTSTLIGKELIMDSTLSMLPFHKINHLDIYYFR